MMFVSVVIGLGIDYGIYFLFRYREERVLGRTLLGALERTAARSGPGILLGALTAAVTFYILTTAEFRGIRDFGFISGTAILLAFLSMLTVFPAAVLLIDRWQNGPPTVRRRPSHSRRARPDARATSSRRAVPALEWLARYPKTIVTTAVVATGASLWAAPRVGFDYNLLNLQADGTESVVWERKAAAAAETLRVRRALDGDLAPELEARQAAFQRLPSVSDVQSVLSVLPDQQAEKLALLQRLGDVADSIRAGASAPPRSACAHRGARDLEAPTGPRERPQRSRRAAGGDPRHRARDVGPPRAAQGARAAAPSRSRSPITRRGWRPTSPSSGGGSSSPPGRRRSRSATCPKSYGESSSARAAACSCRSTPGSTSGTARARRASWRSCGPSTRTSPASRSSAYESTRLIERSFRLGLAYAFVLVAGDRGAHDPPRAGDRARDGAR